MTKREMIEIMAIISAAYPGFYDKKTESDKITALRLWYRYFAAVDYDIMLQTIDAVIISNRFPPTIAEVNEKLELVLNRGQAEMSEHEAWICVRDALCGNTDDYKSKFEDLPLMIKNVIKTPEQLRKWAALEENIINSVVESDFLKLYRIEQEKQKQRIRLPSEYRKNLQQTQYRDGGNMTEEI